MSSQSQNNNRGRDRGASQRHELTRRGPAPGEERRGETAGDSHPGGEEAEVEPTLDKLLAKLPAELRRQEKRRLDGLEDKLQVARQAAQIGAPASHTLDEYDAMIELVHDPLWSADDTANLQATLEPLKRFLAGKRPLEFDQLWRIVPRIMRCVPVDIMDGRRLTYDADLVSIEGEQVRNPIWPPAFCKSLRVLVTHPFFEGCPGLLVLAVQYAVKLRTNDRRRWPLENSIECPFLDELAAAFASPHPELDARELHKRVNQARQGRRRPLVSRVLQSIESVVDVSNAVFQGSADPFDSYMVTVTDLRNIASALDNVAFSLGLHFDSDHIFTAVKVTLQSNDLPSKVAGVTRALQKAHVRLAQMAILAERRVAALANSPSGLNSGAVVPPASGPAAMANPPASGPNAGPVVPLASNHAVEAENKRLRQLLADMEEKHREEVERLSAELEDARNALHQDEPPLVDDEFSDYANPGTPPDHSVHSPSPPRSPAPIHMNQILMMPNGENDPVTAVADDYMVRARYAVPLWRGNPRGYKYR